MAFLLYRYLKNKRNGSSKNAPKPCEEHQIVTQGNQLTTGAIFEQQTETIQEDKTLELTSPVPAPSGKCQECKKDTHDRRVYRWKLIVALVIPYMLASLDLTIVATASPFVAADFGKLNQLNWIAVAYTLTATTFIPTFGQLSDVLGRHTVLQISMFFMLIGSTLCAAAQTWGMLLFGRALQGTSAAGIMNLIKIVLADKVSLAENSKNTTVFALVGGISYSIGPIIGGFLTSANWRYCFVLPIPLSLLGSLLLFVLVRKELVRGTHQDSISWKKPSSIVPIFAILDVGGTVLFIFGVGLIILGTAWGGSTFPWSSAAVLVPIVVGPILFFGFFVYEYLLEPGRFMNRKFPKQIGMIPWSIFKRRDAFLLAVINLSTGAALYSIFYFMGIYWTVAQGYKASDAGVALIFYLPGLGGGVYLCMVLVNFWPGQTYWPLLLGSVIEAAGFGLVTWAVTTSNAALVKGMMAVAGFGTGLRFMPCTLHGVGIWPTRIASILSVMDFALPFGGTLALTIMGSVFNNKMEEFTSALGVTGVTSNSSSGSSHGLGVISKLPPELRAHIRAAAGKAVMWAFASILPLMGCCVLASLFLGNVWIKGKKKDGTAQVIYSSYLIAKLTGTVDAKKTTNPPAFPESSEVETKVSDSNI